MDNEKKNWIVPGVCKCNLTSMKAFLLGERKIDNQMLYLIGRKYFTYVILKLLKLKFYFGEEKKIQGFVFNLRSKVLEKN